MKIKYTRAMLNAALDGDLDDVEYVWMRDLDSKFQSHAQEFLRF